MDVHEFSKIISTDRKKEILTIMSDPNQQKELFSVYELHVILNKNGNKINYKNTRQIFHEFLKYGIIELNRERIPPRYPINYKITERGKKILELEDEINKTLKKI